MPFYKKFNKEEEQVKEVVYDEIFGDRIERQGVEELIESVQSVSKQLEIILEEVNKRDEKVEELEAQLEDRFLIIERLTADIELGVMLNNEKEKMIEDLKVDIMKQQERIERRNAKIKRLEEENQEIFDNNCKLKEEINGLRQINEELEKKLTGISEFFK